MHISLLGRGRGLLTPAHQLDHTPSHRPPGLVVAAARRRHVEGRRHRVLRREGSPLAPPPRPHPLPGHVAHSYCFGAYLLLFRPVRHRGEHHRGRSGGGGGGCIRFAAYRIHLRRTAALRTVLLGALESPPEVRDFLPLSPSYPWICCNVSRNNSLIWIGLHAIISCDYRYHLDRCCFTRFTFVLYMTISSPRVVWSCRFLREKVWYWNLGFLSLLTNESL